MRSDAERWIDYHGRAYPGFCKWIAVNPGQVDHLKRLLEEFAIENLQAATDALYARDDQPAGYGSHGRAIRRLCSGDQVDHHTSTREVGPTVNDDRLTARCVRCMDFGTVEVLSPATVTALRRAIRTDRDAEPICTCVVACDCDLGADAVVRMQLPRWREGVALVRYETILDTAVDQIRDHGSMQAAEWAIALDAMKEITSREDRHVHPDFEDYA